ncbi:hypothetical protein GJ654_15480 [Rhodoblastus acidophilus]|uniref:Uncharacterized protein n=1 Tax=Rhodoblastus acidophilus TaxID=1074 RepID=A0A6N8DPA0_RHOAC|nr:hypothetical protein [Rhodoblastus acidophilus]MCW2275785.1 hypothetical protein [Rhodoblastus acidophilus]MTV32390.1 hypothetical protein [Rhodoblastus acidophilus]
MGDRPAGELRAALANVRCPPVPDEAARTGWSCFDLVLKAGESGFLGNFPLWLKFSRAKSRKTDEFVQKTRDFSRKMRDFRVCTLRVVDGALGVNSVRRAAFRAADGDLSF